MQRIPTIIISLLISVCASAAPMTRVLSIKDGRTIVVDGGAELRLAGIEITNEVGARDLLRWTVGTSWVMVERDQNGAARIYRSPDGMFINRELVLRGYARATEPGIEPDQQIAVTYLGVVNLGPRTSSGSGGGGGGTVSPRAPRTGNGKSARSPAPRAPRPPRQPTSRPRR